MARSSPWICMKCDEDRGGGREASRTEREEN